MEFEVCKEAVENYKKYDIYKDWKVCGSEKRGRPFRPSMCGYYLKSDKFPNCTIVGDILTSNNVWGRASQRDDKIRSALSLFEKIYHVDGNYLPIPEIRNERTGNLSGKNCDTYTHHLNVCKQAIEKNLKSYKVWDIWARYIWLPYCGSLQCDKPWDKFVEEHYLWDFVDENKQPKSFVVGRNASNQVGVRADDKDENIFATISNSIELIIMRDYRIKKCIKTVLDASEREAYNTYRREFLKQKECAEEAREWEKYFRLD